MRTIFSADCPASPQQRSLRQTENSMLGGTSKFRTALALLAALGMVVPAWAASPCYCGQREGGCSQQPAQTRSCCTAHKTCCSEQKAPDFELDCPSGKTCAHCPCCSEGPLPALSTPPSTAVSTDQDQAIVNGLTALLPSPDAQLCFYLAQERGSPPGHPALRLHALKCVWLN
ncbi:hypothetical protein Pla144_37480 [Bythopirellula polymerisocia]|uniref:Uncharacterized protein n=1 Tax=Bythopirellula polymerisocia TaxID=2528003 RepID=A0A5C6CFA8_9BACT|nr:hypothetical protein Pla144_37480 [Bythopirellula polymerisocia]